MQIVEDFEQDPDQQGYKKVPHTTQILSLLVMFDLHKEPSLKPQALSNNAQRNALLALNDQLIQIKTGQGKSIILGMASSMFALLGHATDVVCYSPYLSKRDEGAFMDIFKHCQI